MLRRTIAMLAVAVALWAPVARAESVAGTIVRVVDGDTVDVRVSGKVERIRIIGLDTPETVDPRKPVQCFGRQATARAKELLPAGSSVALETDPTQGARDRYSRMLAHVIIDAEEGESPNFAVRMIAEGFAHHYIYRVPSVWSADLASAQTVAEAEAKGLWSPETCAGQASPKRDLDDDATEQPASNTVPVGKDPDEFDPSPYIGKGNKFNCDAFANQAQAQAVLRADPRDPNRIDPDRDGIACESNRAPKDTSPVKR